MEEYIAPNRKRIPYGMMNFAVIRRDDCYYVDKTRFIPIIEDADKFFFFIRPRRFGKSLTVSMLQHYYDIAAKDKFDALFGDLYIGKYPTRDRNSYLVLYLNFSGIVGELHNYRKGLDAHCQTMFDYFCDIYADYLPQGIKEKLDAKEGAVEQFEYLFTECNKTGQRIYLFIDEYDHFTNAILADPESLHRYTNETHGEGYLRAFFNKVKAGTYSSIERCFITGVSPVTMDDLTSGFNIGTNYSLSPKFNEMIGFTEEEVRQMLTYYSTTSHFNHTVDELLDIMQPWYDNYCFAKDSLDSDPKMFNCDMVLYYLRNYIDGGKAPEQMIDPNTRTDYNKMKKLIQLDRLDGDRKGVLRRITEEGRIVADLVTSFPARDIIKPEIFPSLLFYYGMLTIVGTDGQRPVLGIPNNNVRKQYYDFMLEEYQEKHSINLERLMDQFDAMAYKGEWSSGLEFIARAYKENSAVRSAIEGERNLQGFFTAYLSICNYYLVAPEMELNHGFCDLFLMANLTHYAVAHSYIIELKYLAVKDSDSKAEAQWQDAVNQIRLYAAAPRVERLRQGTQLHCIIMQFRGCELERAEEVQV